MGYFLLGWLRRGRERGRLSLWLVALSSTMMMTMKPSRNITG
jgi:hypothetical protein